MHVQQMCLGFGLNLQFDQQFLNLIKLSFFGIDLGISRYKVFLLFSTCLKIFTKPRHQLIQERAEECTSFHANLKSMKVRWTIWSLWILPVPVPIRKVNLTYLYRSTNWFSSQVIICNSNWSPVIICNSYWSQSFVLQSPLKHDSIWRGTILRLYRSYTLLPLLPLS